MTKGGEVHREQVYTEDLFTKRLIEDDGTEYELGVDIPATGGSTGTGDSTPRPFDALVYQKDPTSPGTTDYTYQNTGRRGSSGTTTHADLSAALTAFYEDYPGDTETDVGDTPGVCAINAGVHIPQGEIIPRRGCHVVGPGLIHSRGYKGGPSRPTAGLDDIICTIWSRDLTNSQVLVRADPNAQTGDPKGAGFGFINFEGDDREQDLILVKNSDRNVFYECKFANTNGTALVNSGGFATITMGCQWQDCGQYDAGAGIDNPAVHSFQDPDTSRSANFKIWGGKLLGEQSDAGTQIRAPQGVRFLGGGAEASCKMENAATIPAIEGSNLKLRNVTVTGLFQTGPIGIRVSGGDPRLEKVRVEKIGTGFEIDNFSNKSTPSWSDIQAIGNAGNGIEINTTGQLLPTINGGTIGGNGGDAIFVDSAVSNTVNMQLNGIHFYDNAGYVLNDQRAGSQETSTMRFMDTKVTDVGTGVFNPARYISDFSGDLVNRAFVPVTIPSGTSTGTAAHGLYSEWDPVAARRVSWDDANGPVQIENVTSVDSDSDGYNEEIEVSVDAAPSADTIINMEVLGRTAIGGDSATAPIL